MSQHASVASANIDRPPAVQEDAPPTGAPAAAADNMLERIPPEVRDSFSPAQRHALGVAITEAAPRRFLVNFRFTVLGHFVNFIVGRENRGAARRAAEREKHPILTLGNMVALLLVCPFGIALGWAAYVLLLHRL